MAIPTLNYFDGPGRAEASRLAFHVGGVEFKDRRFTHEQWGAEYKAKAPTGLAPWLELEDGSYIVESKAILMYAANMADLIPKDPVEAAVAEQACGIMEACYGPLKSLYMNTEVEKAKVELAEKLSVADKVIATRQSESTGFISNAGFSYADLFVFTFVLGVTTRFPDAMNIEDYPHLKKVYEAVKAYPKVAEYYKSRQ
ncbi:glutathione S-transferase [Gregarina niphandrodes]|uniref:Glutathione S-transferase n=1 Tax=Gregarina niphandrodes TaxID=110365 RepID=A0A023B336_GRENI|nr:glutathione S-transferase [Gregarina niphandrodes]EZG55049.1 glutathione S-transferase [Gregarina niphandrodes]|eukprot:XP_011131816.1 glutathione S-transferase [Gregarina niphandrodes]